MRRLRVGLIGAGNVAATVHAPGYARLADRVDLVAVCDRDLGRAQSLADRHGIPRAHTSWEAMLGAGGLDAVSVCVANNLHAPAALAAFGAGLHVLCEKPPALNPAEARAMGEAAAAAGKVLAFGLHWRFRPEVQEARRMAERGDLGRVYAGRIRASRRRGIPGWGSFTDKAIQGGGPLMDLGVHLLDAALHILGYPEVASVQAMSYAEIGTRAGPGLLGSWDPSRFGVEDSLFAAIRFADGGSLLLETAFALNMGEKSLMELELFGSRAGVRLFPFEVHGEANGALCDISLPFLPATDPHEACVEDFVDACLSGRPARSGPAEGLALQSLVGLLYRSAELGRPLAAGEGS